MSRIEVAKSDEVREGAMHAVQAGGRAALLTRVNGKPQAIENKCPHLGLPLARGKIVDGSIRCPWHGSRFDICSGKNLDWVNSVAGVPMPQWSHRFIALGKEPKPVCTFAAEEEGGKVFVTLP